MEISDIDLMLSYLYEMGSFDLMNADMIPPFLTKEAVSLKCGIKLIDLDEILSAKKDLFKVKNVTIRNRRLKSDSIFLTSKGVLEAKVVFEQMVDKRVEFIDEDGDQKNLQLSSIKEILESFNINITNFDLFQRDRRDHKVNLIEFIEPENWKESIISDHAFPEMIILSNTSCQPFGGIFTAFGEPGIILPINKRVEIGIHPYGKGNVIRWMKRKGSKIKDAFYIDGKNGFEALTSGHSSVMGQYSNYKDLGVFENEGDFKEYFNALKNYDYSIIFSDGTAHGISMAGHIGTILATIAIHEKDKIEFPLNGASDPPLNPKIIESDKVPVWDFSEPSEAVSIMDMIIERHGQGEVSEYMAKIMRKFITLSQVFERHWNSSFGEEDMGSIKKFQEVFNLREFSSGGACVSSIFASPVLVNLDDNGSVSLSTTIHPEMPPNKNIGLVVDRKGGIDNPRNEFIKTFKRFKPLIENHGRDSLPYFYNLKTTSGELAKLSSKVILENQKFADPNSSDERKAITDLLMMQKGIYSSLGIENPLLEFLESQIIESKIDMALGHIGVGNSGTFFFCVPDVDSMHSFRNLIDKINLSRTEGERIELVTHGSSHRYVFNIDPLMVVKK